MSLRLVFVLSICAIFVATNAKFADEPVDLDLVNHAVAEEKSDELTDFSVEQRNAYLEKAIRILQQAIKWAKTACLIQAANQCKRYWNNPGALIVCGSKYLQANKGRCYAG